MNDQGQGPRAPRLLGRLRGSRGADEDGSSTGTQVTYARSLDGRHLWLAFDGPVTGLGLRDERSGAVTAVADRGEVVSLAGLESDYVLVNADGPVPVAPGAIVGDGDSLTQGPAVDGWRTEVTSAEGVVRVARRAVDVRAVVRRMVVDEQTVRVFFDTDLAEPTGVAVCGPDGQAVVVLPIEEGASFTLDAATAGLEAGTAYELRLASSDGQVPLVRRQDGLRRPGAAIAMPRVSDGPSVLRLRFVRGGRLTVQLTVAGGDER